MESPLLVLKIQLDKVAVITLALFPTKTNQTIPSSLGQSVAPWKAHKTFLTTSTWAKGMKLPVLTLWNLPLMLIIIKLAGSLCASWFQDLHIFWIPLSLRSISQDIVPDFILSGKAGKPSLQTESKFQLLSGLFKVFIIMVLNHGCAFAIPSLNPTSFSFRA